MPEFPSSAKVNKCDGSYLSFSDGFMRLATGEQQTDPGQKHRRLAETTDFIKGTREVRKDRSEQMLLAQQQNEWTLPAGSQTLLSSMKSLENSLRDAD